MKDHELVELLVYNSNTVCLCSEKISRLNLESLPSFDLSASINNNRNLSNIDIDLSLPSVTNFGLALGEIIPLYMQLSLLQTKFKEQLKMAYFRVVFFLIFLKPLILLTIAYY